MRKTKSLKTLISIIGPTGIGKTTTAIELARMLETEIISADSRQFYKEMSIGTAKPNADELASAPHHFINSHSIQDVVSAGDFEKEGIEKINLLFEQHDTLVMAGGSGLFVNAILEGLDDLPKAKEGVREALNQAYLEKGLSYLQAQLKDLDPHYYHEVDTSNPQRIIRALEVVKSTGIPFSSWRKNKKNARDFNVISIGLEVERAVLYDRINQRVDNMMIDGLLEEAERLYPFKHLPALQTVGYTELFDYFDNKHSLEDAIAKIKQNSRKYAKRQITWFKRNPNTIWFNPSNSSLIKEYLQHSLSELD